MSYGPDYIKAQALTAAQTRLKKAATFTRMAIKTPLFQKRMGKGDSAVLVRLEWPGVLRVVDPQTGELLAESVPGWPDVLRPSFTPLVPALAGTGSGGNSQGGRYGHPAP